MDRSCHVTSFTFVEDFGAKFLLLKMVIDKKNLYQQNV